MGRSSERRSSKASHHPNLAMLRIVALFALVAVAFAEPEADPQLFYRHWGVPVVNPVVPVVKYVDPHHTEGMTKEGVPEKTDSVKIAEKHHEYLKTVEEAKKKVVYPYSVYNHGVYNHGVYNPVYYNHGVVPYYNYQYTVPHVVPQVTTPHVVAKREADSDPALLYSTYGHHGVYPHVYGTYPTTTYTGYPYTGYPYTYTYPYTHSYHPYVSSVTAKHVVAKREAEGDAAFSYNTYGYPYHTGYTGYNFYNHFPYTHNYYYGGWRG